MLEPMQELPTQILEVRPAGRGLEASITLAVTSQASPAILTALSEQLDRRRSQPLQEAGDVLELRQATELMERFEALAAAQAHAVVSFSPDELRSCLLELTNYADRMDTDGFQAPELRERLRLIAQITPVLWDANAAASAQPSPAHISE
jgi:hypothetical protein